MRCSCCNGVLMARDERIDKVTKELNTLCSKCLSYSFMDNREFFLPKGKEALLSSQRDIDQLEMEALEAMANVILEEKD